MQPRVTVVVCTRDGSRTLPAVLKALAAQDIEASRMEVIVVDDGSTDSSGAIAADAGTQVIALPHSVGLAAARNAGVAEARGEIIAFTDDDCEPASDWLRELLLGFRGAGVDGVAGRTIPACTRSILFRYLALRSPLSPLPAALLTSSRPLFRLRHYLSQSLGPLPELPPQAPLYSVAGANMAFRGDFLRSLGGFDPSITFGGEEEDLCRRAHVQSPETLLLYRPSAIVRHHFKPGLGDTLRRSRAYGAGNARSMRSGDTPPIVFPFPLLTALALGATLRTRARFLPLAASSPLACYPGWLLYALRTHRLEAMCYPYLQLVQETATMVGECEYHFGAWHR